MKKVVSVRLWHYFVFALFKAQIHRECLSRRGSAAAPDSQGDPGAVVFEFAWQHATVQLVKLHQLYQVGEARVAVIQAKEDLPFVVHLHAGRQRGSGETNLSQSCAAWAGNSQVRSGSV